jgi:hypothetical protein
VPPTWDLNTAIVHAYYMDKESITTSEYY